MTTELSSTRTLRIRSCSTMPACSNASTKARLEPSQPGHSAASISTTQLSTCMPARAAITCSVISTVASPCLIVVRRAEGTTRSIRAGTRGRSGKSVRSKTTPVPGSAGRKRSVTSDPWKNPCPRTSVGMGKRALPALGLLHSLPLQCIAEEEGSVLVGLRGVASRLGRGGGLGRIVAARRGVVDHGLVSAIEVVNHVVR